MSFYKFISSLLSICLFLQHPFLIRGAEDRIIDDAAENVQKSFTKGEKIYRDIDYAKLTGEQLIKSSGKFVLLSKLLPKLQSGGHKVRIRCSLSFRRLKMNLNLSSLSLGFDF